MLETEGVAQTISFDHLAEHTELIAHDEGEGPQVFMLHTCDCGCKLAVRLTVESARMFANVMAKCADVCESKTRLLS